MEEFHELVKIIHAGCHTLCYNALGRYLPVAGNIGVFCQSNAQFEKLRALREMITEPSDNPQQKYFQLGLPIQVNAEACIPQAYYSWLYIRKPANDSPELGDVDFILTYEEFFSLKGAVVNKNVSGAVVYDRPGWDMIELRDTAIPALSYVTYPDMAEKVRVRFD